MPSRRKSPKKKRVDERQLLAIAQELERIRDELDALYDKLMEASGAYSNGIAEEAME